MGPAGRWLLMGGLACALVPAALGIHHVMRGEASRASDAQSARLNGIWRSRGYGWLWQIEDTQVRAFEESGPYCIARPGMRRRLKDLDEGFDLSADGQTLRLSLDDPAYRFTFDRIDVLPEACTRAVDASPVGVIDALGHIFSAHYAFFTARDVDWPALVAATRSKLTADTSEEELLAELGALLANIDDDHVTLSARIGGERFECNPGEAKLLRGERASTCEKVGGAERRVAQLQERVWARQEADALLGDTARTTANGNIKYGLIDGDVGYLGILSMEDFDRGDNDEAALEEALDDVLASFQGARAVIVDVSLNDGGEDRLARAIAARFAAQRTRAYSKYAGDAPGARPQDIYIDPSARATWAPSICSPATSR